MTAEMAKDFFFWCMIINSGVYVVTALATMFIRNFVVSVHARMFGMDQQATLHSVQRYLGNFKLLITVFNFAPWAALHLIS